MVIDCSAAGLSADLLDHLPDTDLLIEALQMKSGISPEERASLLIFDEIQSCPKVWQAFSHLAEDGRYGCIGITSICLTQKEIESLRAGRVETVRMNPMDYEEFLLALSDHVTIPAFEEMYASGSICWKVSIVSRCVISIFI